MSSWIKNINLEGDRTIWGVVLALSLSSVLVVYSTAGWHFLFSHITKLLLGLFAMYVVHKIKFKYFSSANVGRIQNTFTLEIDRVSSASRFYLRGIELSILVLKFFIFVRI